MGKGLLIIIFGPINYLILIILPWGKEEVRPKKGLLNY